MIRLSEIFRLNFMIAPLIFMTGFIACNGFAYANSAPLRATGQTVVPTKDVPVRLETEYLDIRLSSYEAEVACSFYLVNEGPAATIKVGFPAGKNEELENFGASGESFKHYEVKTISLGPSFTNERDMNQWKVFDVPLGSTGKPEILRNQYKVKVNRYGLSELTDRYFRYILKTGAYWKGNIKTLKVTVYLKGVPFDQITRIYPAGYKTDNNKITWEFKNFEPTEDIEIFIMNDLIYDRMTQARKILQKEPNNAHAHYMLGTAIFMKDSKTVGGETIGTIESEKEFLKAIQLDPHHLDAKWFLAALYFMREEKPKALKILSEISDEKPDYFCADKIYNTYWSSQSFMLHGGVNQYIIK